MDPQNLFLMCRRSFIATTHSASVIPCEGMSTVEKHNGSFRSLHDVKLVMTLRPLLRDFFQKAFRFQMRVLVDELWWALDVFQSRSTS